MSSEFGVRRSAWSLSRLTWRVPHFAAVLLLAATAIPQFSVPDAKVLPGWKAGGPSDVYAKADLYGFMDGGAELFFEFGFSDLTVQKYVRGKEELTLEAYRMGDPEGALGIYLIRAGRETAVKGVEGRSTGDRYQFSACKGNFYFQVNNFKGDAKRVPDMIRLLNGALTTLTKDWPEPRDPLPKEHRVPGSFLILRGPLALQRLFTFGEGDILRMKDGATAFAADYEIPGLGPHGLITVVYPNAETSAAGLKYLIGHLDSYLGVVQQAPGRLVFKDAQGKYGDARLDGARLLLRTGMGAEPKE